MRVPHVEHTGLCAGLLATTLSGIVTGVVVGIGVGVVSGVLVVSASVVAGLAVPAGFGGDMRLRKDASFGLPAYYSYSGSFDLTCAGLQAFEPRVTIVCVAGISTFLEPSTTASATTEQARFLDNPTC